MVGPSGDGWPTGTGDTEYHWWSPLVVDYTNSGWTGGPTWATSWQEALRYGNDYLTTLQSSRPDAVLMTVNMLSQCKQSLDSKERFVASSSSGLTDAGFKSLMFEDMEIVTEYGVPDAVGYFLNFDQMELKSMQSQLIEKTDDLDISTSTSLIAADFYGNVMFNSPAFFGKLVAIS